MIGNGIGQSLLELLLGAAKSGVVLRVVVDWGTLLNAATSHSPKKN